MWEVLEFPAATAGYSSAGRITRCRKLFRIDLFGLDASRQPDGFGRSSVKAATRRLLGRILLGMRRAFVCLVASLLLTSCHEGPHINQPSPLPIPTTVPYFLTAGASVGLGADAGRATISVKVQNVEGAPMPDVPVTFATDQGTIDPATAITLADGTAHALLTASVTATVVVSTRTLSQKLLVTAQAPASAGLVISTGRLAR
jgi:hypothetical protein